MSSVGTTNISFSGLRGNWSNESFSNSSGQNSTDPGNNSNIKLSEFRGATFATSTGTLNSQSVVPLDTKSALSIDEFKGKTFGTRTFYLRINNLNDSTAIKYAITDSSSTVNPAATTNSPITIAQGGNASMTIVDAQGGVSLSIYTVSGRSNNLTALSAGSPTTSSGLVYAVVSTGVGTLKWNPFANTSSDGIAAGITGSSGTPTIINCKTE